MRKGLDRRACPRCRALRGGASRAGVTSPKPARYRATLPARRGVPGQNVPPRSGAAGKGRDGFSLLEVILALAILCGSIAVLGEAIRLGMRSAEIARDTTEAQLLCRSKMAEITAGITPADPVQRVPFDCPMGDGRTIWLYSVNLEDTEEEGLDLVCVTVTQDLPPEKQPVEVSLFRWIPDAGMGTSLESETEGSSEGETGE